MLAAVRASPRCAMAIQYRIAEGAVLEFAGMSRVAVAGRPSLFVGGSALGITIRVEVDVPHEEVSDVVHRVELECLEEFAFCVVEQPGVVGPDSSLS